MRTTLPVLLPILASLLAGCSPDGAPTLAPRSESQTSGIPRVAAPSPVLQVAAATHAAESAHHADEGGVALTGRVVGLGSRGERPRAFQIELEPTGRSAGAPPLRVVFGSRDGAFRLWPPPGEYRLRARAGTWTSEPRLVQVAPGLAAGPLVLELGEP